MIKELFKPGDVLFYDKIHEGISNLSSEDADTQIYFDSNQYSALGVVVAVDEVSSTLKLITPALYPYLIMKLPNADGKDLLKDMNDKVKDCFKFFKKECGNQKTVKMYIPEASDIDMLCENAEDILMGCESMQYFCNQFMHKYNFRDIVATENLGFIDKKKLIFLFSGVDNAVEYNRNQKLKEIELRNAKDFANQDIRSLDIAFATDATEEDMQKFFNAENKVEVTDKVSAESVFNKIPTKIEVDEANLANSNMKECLMIKSLAEVKEEFKRADQMEFWLVPFMSVQVE